MCGRKFRTRDKREQNRRPCARGWYIETSIATRGTFAIFSGAGRQLVYAVLCAFLSAPKPLQICSPVVAIPLAKG